MKQNQEAMMAGEGPNVLMMIAMIMITMVMINMRNMIMTIS